MADIDRTGDKISTFYFMKMPQKLATLMMCLATGLVTAQETATVKATRVNVRGQATLNSEIVTQLNPGETIKVLEQITLEKPGPGEPAKWAKIALPANTPVWINASFIKEGEVSSNRLNVRSGPGENYSVLGRLEKGAKVQAIRTVDDWMEIVAPEGTYAFVSVDFLEIKGAAEVAKAETKPAEAAAKPVMKSKTESVEPLPTVKVESPAQPAPRPSAVTEVSSAKVINDPTPVPPPQPVVVAPPAPVQPKLDPVAIPVPPPTVTANAPIIEVAPPQVRIITREGVVRRTISVQAPSAYRLADPERATTTINYLYPGDTGLELKWFLGRKIRVSGTESLDPRWPNMPLIEIKTLEPLDE
jgi:uncharacterized protein YgiM (DUF1202 family)